MPSRNPSTIAVLIAVTALLAPLLVQGDALATTPGLQVDTIAELRVATEDVTGLDKFVPAERLRVGDEIFYTLQVRNPGATEIRDVVVVKAVPNNTEYLVDSAVGPAAIISLSIDGGATFVTRRELDTKAAERYTHIRWQLRHPLAPGATALLRFRSVFK